MVAPVLIMLIIGICDIGYMAYSTAVLRGAVETAARSSSLETADTTEADAQVTEAVRNILPDATVATTRKSYYDFTNIDQPEPWDDENDNATCDDGEVYTDENGNDQWDADVGVSGNGGANDVVVYTATVTYTPLFPIPFIDGSDAARTLTASSVKKNQPFATQAEPGSSAETCT